MLFWVGEPIEPLIFRNLSQKQGIVGFQSMILFAFLRPSLFDILETPGFNTSSVFDSILLFMNFSTQDFSILMGVIVTTTDGSVAFRVLGAGFRSICPFTGAMCFWIARNRLFLAQQHTWLTRMYRLTFRKIPVVWGDRLFDAASKARFDVHAQSPIG